MAPHCPECEQAESYTNVLHPAFRPPQSSRMLGFAETEPAYTLSSALSGRPKPLPETGSPPATPDRVQSLTTSSPGVVFDHMPAYRPYAPRSDQRQSWSSPLVGTHDCELCDCRDSPTVDYGASGYKLSPHSTWSTPGPDFSPPTDYFTPQLEQEDPSAPEVLSPASAAEVYVTEPARSAAKDNYPLSIEAQSSFEYRPQCIGDCCRGPSQEFIDYYERRTLPRSTTPVLAMIPDMGHQAVQTATPVPPVPSPVPQVEETQRTQRLEERLEGPYAWLIYQALLSRPNHSMTLQEIYKWFRDNTTKARKSYKGWQNSIRHNLSMNAAFTNRDQSGNETTKRSAEWVLEDWAVNGVQSTTRYRKGGSGRRGVGRKSNARRRSKPSPKRAARWTAGPSVDVPLLSAPQAQMIVPAQYHGGQQIMSSSYPMEQPDAVKHEFDSMPPTPDQAHPGPIHPMMSHAGSPACGSNFGGMMPIACGADPAQMSISFMSTSFPYSMGDIQVHYANGHQGSEHGPVGTVFLPIPDGISGWDGPQM